jgi:hypothetical protein
MFTDITTVSKLLLFLDIFYYCSIKILNFLMDKAQVVKVLKRTMSSIRDNRKNDAINDLHILISDLERRIKEDDFDAEYILDEPN